MFALMGQSSFEKGSETCIVHIVLYFIIYSMKKLLIAMVFVLSLFSFVSADKLDDAIAWMYDNGLTIHAGQMTYKADSWLRRDEAAKFYVNFSKLLGKTTYVKTASQCKFSDINDSWSDLKDIVVESCRLWLFQWSKGKFSPKTQLTNAQAITVLVRLLAGNQSEVWVSHRANNYYTKANELGILENVAMNNKDSIANRGNVALIIYNGNNLGNKSTLATFSDTEVWVSFAYPSSWGTITKDSETNSWNKYLIVLLKNWNTFFAFHNWWTPVARWGFWGDWAQNINSTWFVHTFCQAQPNCTIQMNTNWVEYAKYIYQYGEMWSSQTYTWIGYMIFNPNSSYRGIIMSNERIPNESVSDLDAIINSLSFL